MYPLPQMNPGEPAPGHSGFGKGDRRGRKRKHSRSSTATSSVDGESRNEPKERMCLLSKLHRKRPDVDSLKSAREVVIEVFEEACPSDITFALCYSVRDDTRNNAESEICPDNNSSLSPDRYILEGHAGLKKIDANFDLQSVYKLVSARLCEEPGLDGPRLLKINGRSPLRKFLRYLTNEVYQPVDRLALCPILAHGITPIGCMLFGVSSKSYDEDCEMFLQVLSDVLSKLFSMCLMRKNLQDIRGASKVVLSRAQEAERSNFMFRHMAESATVGCAIFDPTGHPMWMNEAYLNLTGIAKEDFRPGVWQKALLAEDALEVEARWKKLAAGEPIAPFTFRVKRHHDPTAKPGSCESLDYRCLLSNAYVDFNEDGSCRRIMGWLTDISAQKFNEHLQTQRLADALETKRQTEKFIDMVSHEIRNPLSAIIQTADGVLASMGHQNEERIPIDIRESVIDAGKVIILCAHHQKRIVDDILTLSKLDSNLLVISPVDVQPRDLVHNAMKMFEAEFASAKIEASISIDKSYEALSVQNVLLDESRVLQILLNLITNAIKFTRNQVERRVKTRLAASETRPSIEASDISYIAPRVSQLMKHASNESIIKESIYLIFAVEDTGPGLSKNDMKNLFQRFSQASPKTYRGYGGFGLGLFICRELAELQGGQIGLSSVLGQGTTLTFYVRAQRQKLNTSDILVAPSIGCSATTARIHVPDLSGNVGMSPIIQHKLTTTTLTTELDPQNLHILIVEDDKINQTVLVRQLRLLGCTVYTADHGLEALELLSRSSFKISPICQNGVLTPPIQLSVILMDVEMPVMDGLACVRRIREMEVEGTIKHVPVIAVTANARSDQISGAMEAGMDSVLTKPLRIPELISMIATVIKVHDFGV